MLEQYFEQWVLLEFVLPHINLFLVLYLVDLVIRLRFHFKSSLFLFASLLLVVVLWLATAFFLDWLTLLGRIHLCLGFSLLVWLCLPVLISLVGLFLSFFLHIGFTFFFGLL